MTAKTIDRYNHTEGYYNDVAEAANRIYRDAARHAPDHDPFVGAEIGAGNHSHARYIAYTKAAKRSTNYTPAQHDDGYDIHADAQRYANGGEVE